MLQITTQYLAIRLRNFAFTAALTTILAVGCILLLLHVLNVITTAITILLDISPVLSLLLIVAIASCVALTLDDANIDTEGTVGVDLIFQPLIHTTASRVKKAGITQIA